MDLHRLQELFVANYGSLQDGAYSENPSLLVWDCDRIMEQLAARLPSYTGRLEPESFVAWALDSFVRREAERYEITEMILRDYRRLLMAAITRSLRTTSMDCAVDPDDMFNEIAALIFARAHEFAEPGTAKLSTRLVALAKTHVRFRKTKQNNRFRLVTELAAGGYRLGVECLTEAEMAAERADALAA